MSKNKIKNLFEKKLIYFLLILIIFNVVLFILSLENNLVEPFGIAEDKISPKRSIDFSSIKRTQDSITFNVEDSIIVKFADTNSMDPTIDKESTGILIPLTMDKINIGDIIVYKYKLKNIVHRVIKKGNDSNGIYLITKGDNLKNQDPIKIRSSMLIGKIVGILY